jgi:hypothetical protein
MLALVFTMTGGGCFMTADDSLWQDTAVPDAPAHDVAQPDLATKDLVPDQPLPNEGPTIDTLQPDAPKPDAACKQMVLLLSAAANDGQVEGDQYFHANGETNYDIWMGAWGSMYIWGFYRFALSEALPQGATVAKATLELWGHKDFTYALTKWNPALHALEIYAESSANPPIVTKAADGPFTPLGRALTAAKVRWPASGGLTWSGGQYNTTPDFASVLQEVITLKSGLAKGAHVQIWIRGAQLKTSHVTANAYGMSGYVPGRLTIDWCI